MQNGNKPVCLVFGGNGQVGNALQPALAEAYCVRALTRAECNVSDVAAIAAVIADVHPAVIINATAYNAVDKAESEPEAALAINRDAVAAMAQGACKVGSAFVHYSTDYVFDGLASSPYRESDAPNPLNAYAMSKLAGEQVVQEILGDTHPYWILRTSWVFGTHGSNFLKAVMNLARTRDTLSMVDDQTGTPTSADAIAQATVALLRIRPPSGLYHLSCRGACTRFDYARFILECAEASGETLRVPSQALGRMPTSAYPSPAERPAYSALDSSKLEAALEQVMPDWQTEVVRVVNQLKE
jgi:dTDP-4-dehydrorhamnose reductase